MTDDRRTWGVTYAEVMGEEVPPRATLYTVAGTGVDMWTGYPADLGRAVDPMQWYWQPVQYGPGGIPAAFPMQPSIDTGTAEMARLLRLRPTTVPWAFASYSQGAIVTADILDRLKTDLADYAGSFRGGVTFGNPRREASHTIPGGIDPGGAGIVAPNLVGTPPSVWDFAAGAKMVGSPGNDLYTTAGVGEDAQALADQRAIWELVDNVTVTSLLGSTSLVAEIFGLLANPLPGGISAVEAILGALDFFGIEGITPHTSYQFVQPIAGDPRTCTQIALDYLNKLGASIQTV